VGPAKKGSLEVKRSLVYLSLLVFVVSLASTVSVACTAPSSAGVNICSPAAGQTVAYPAQISAAASANAGHNITAIAVYANGSRIAFQNGASQITDIDSSLKAGAYQLVINAWDETGQLYSSRSSFTVAGGQTTGCVPPAAGILFCSPANGSWQPTNNVPGNVAALGDGAPITRMQVFIDGALMQDGSMSNLQFTAGFGDAGTHTLSAKAWDGAGHVYSSTTKFNTYYDGICSPKGCAPGVFIQSPGDGATVSTTFPLRADVENTNATITAMRAYFDGQLVASSSGPTMIANVDAARGQHVLNVQAWDTQGKLYRTIETITVQ
jgi:hypothetical protein